MPTPFTDRPGAHERHLLRRRDNPLFPPHLRSVSPQQLRDARQRDREESERFQNDFQELVRRAMSLKPQEESEVILELKAQLDRAYIQCAGLGGDNAALLSPLQQLIDLIFKAVRAGAGDDVTAHRELDQEESARAKNRELLAHPLVADLMRPGSPIADDELVPVLLGAAPSELDAALWLFDAGQLETLCAEARGRLLAKDNDGSPAFQAAAKNLRHMESQLAQTSRAD